MFEYQNGEYRYQTGQGPPPLSASVFEHLGYQQAEWDDRRRQAAQMTGASSRPMTLSEMSIAWGVVGAIIGGVIAIAYVSNRHWSELKVAWVVGLGIIGGATAAIAVLWTVIGAFLLMVAIVVLVFRLVGLGLYISAIVAALGAITWGIRFVTCHYVQVCKFYFVFPK